MIMRRNLFNGLLLLAIVLAMAIPWHGRSAYAAIGDVFETRLVVYDYNQLKWRHASRGEISGRPQIVTKTTDFTVPSTANSDTVYILTGAGGGTFTLPAATGRSGDRLTFVNAGSGTMTVTDPTATNLITNGNASATSVAFSTTSHKTGACVVLFSDGTNWYAFNRSDCTMSIS